MAQKTISFFRRFGFPVFCLVLVLLYFQPLHPLYLLATRSDKYSHLLLIPFLSLFFLILDRKKLVVSEKYSYVSGLILCGAGLIFFVVSRILVLKTHPILYLDFLTLSFLCFFTGATFFRFGFSLFTSNKFPWLLLILLIPVPSKLLEIIIAFFQYGSAEVVNILLPATGLDYIRENLLTFRMPSLSIFIAKECSGIRSSTALLVTGLLAGHLFLKTYRGKSVFILAVIPLTLIKNGIRITTLSVLANKLDTKWITDSRLHHEGGFVFFGIVLILFFALLFLIQKLERHLVTKAPVATPNPPTHPQPPTPQ